MTSNTRRKPTGEFNEQMRAIEEVITFSKSELYIVELLEEILELLKP